MGLGGGSASEQVIPDGGALCLSSEQIEMIEHLNISLNFED